MVQEESPIEKIHAHDTQCLLLQLRLSVEHAYMQ